MKNAEYYPRIGTGATIEGWTPHLTRKPHENNRVSFEEFRLAVGYNQGFDFIIVAIFSEEEQANIFVESLNKIEGYQLYVSTVLIPE